MTDLLEETGETGDERADAALDGLARLGALPVSAHADVFEGVFTGLEQALAAVNGTSGREPATADDTPGRGLAAVDDTPGRVTASERVIASPDGGPGQGPASAYGLPGHGHTPADGTSDRRP